MGTFNFIERFTSVKNPHFSLLLVHFLPKNSQYKKSFFLEIKEGAKCSLVRFDKNSRIAPIEIIKNALRILKDRQDSILTHNLNHSRIAPQYKLPFMRDIKDFLDFKAFLQTYKNPSQIWLEIGFGSGRHLLHNAKTHPEILHIGLEIHHPSLEQVARQIGLLSLQNIAILAYDARIFLELLPSNSLDKIFVHFPVPWNKKPHRRIFSSAFLEQSLRTLKQQGILHLRTDSKEYFDFAKELSKSFQDDFKVESQINAKEKTISKYEARWLKEKKTIYNLDLCALHSSPQNEKNFDFSFWGDSFRFKPHNFQSTKIVETNAKKEGYFLHIEDLFCASKKRLLKITLGDFNYPEMRYIIHATQTRYFRENPLPTYKNHQAHNLLLKLISGNKES